MLDRVSNILKDVTTKNSLSNDNLLVFEIKRDKNADTFINNILSYEIMARLMATAPYRT